MFRKLFGKKKFSEVEEQKLEEEWYDHISKSLCEILGKEHDMVMHALIPYEVGGALDLYYYPNGVEGTAIATKELSHACRESSTNDKFEKFEFVMFTKEALDLDLAHDEETAFGRAHQNISSILNPVASYSEQAKLNPYETLEFPSDFEKIAGKCLIFSDYNSSSEDKEPFGLMVIIELFRSEMDYARENGGLSLIDLLKSNGVYPYCDLNRAPVV